MFKTKSANCKLNCTLHLTLLHLSSVSPPGVPPLYEKDPQFSKLRVFVFSKGLAEVLVKCVPPFLAGLVNATLRKLPVLRLTVRWWQAF